MLQAYLRRTEKDVERMCELKARVRLCKGAYKEPPHLAWQDMPAIRERYRRYSKQLLLHARYPGIATHDDELIAATKAFVTEASINRGEFEFQMLYGIRPGEQKRLAGLGHRMRVYVPYGNDWYAYLVRRLAERPANLGFFVRSLVTKN